MPCRGKKKGSINWVRDAVIERALCLDARIGAMAVEARARGLDREEPRQRLLRRVRRGETPEATETARRIGRRAREDLILGAVPYVIQRCLRLAPEQYFPEAFEAGIRAVNTHIDDWDPSVKTFQKHLSSFMNFRITDAWHLAAYPEMTVTGIRTYLRIEDALGEGTPWREISASTGISVGRIGDAVGTHLRATADSIEAIAEGDWELEALGMDDGNRYDPPFDDLFSEDWEAVSEMLRRLEADGDGWVLFLSAIGEMGDAAASKRLGITQGQLRGKKVRTLWDLRKEFLEGKRGRDG